MIDWTWFNTVRQRREALIASGLCPHCEHRPIRPGFVVCGAPDCVGPSDGEVFDPSDAACGYCGGPVAGTGRIQAVGFITYPTIVYNCQDCKDRRVPPL